jgi:sec-independent protein translocase protein TatB
MFDIGFSELLVIGVVALLVIGPERLPKVARTAGVIFGRFQRYVANVKGDIQRELDASEISRLKTEVQDAARSFEQNVNEQVQSVDSSAKELEQSLKTSADLSSQSASHDAAFEAATLPPAAAEAVPTVADANAPASISPPVPAAAADQVAAPAPTAESRPAA